MIERYWRIDLTAHFGFSSDDTRDTVVRSKTGEDMFWPSNFLPCKLSLFGKTKLFRLIVIPLTQETTVALSYERIRSEVAHFPSSVVHV